LDGVLDQLQMLDANPAHEHCDEAAVVAPEETSYTRRVWVCVLDTQGKFFLSA
jgi:hypothetical protein